MNMSVQNRHAELMKIPDQWAVSLTPDILKILEETREWAMEELSAAWNYSESDESRSEIQELEEKNFKVYSWGWEVIKSNIWDIKINDLKDMIEIIWWEFDWEQLFSQAAAIRTTKLNGRKLPSSNDWLRIIQYHSGEIDVNNEWHSDECVTEDLEIRKVWYGSWDHIQEYWRMWCFWTSEESIAVYFTNRWVNPNENTWQGNMFSVRCLKNNN